MEDACWRVTMLAIGVVRSFENAPAKNPTPSSSETGRLCVDALRERKRDWRRKL